MIEQLLGILLGSAGLTIAFFLTTCGAQGHDMNLYLLVCRRCNKTDEQIFYEEQ